MVEAGKGFPETRAEPSENHSNTKRDHPGRSKSTAHLSVADIMTARSWGNHKRLVRENLKDGQEPYSKLQIWDFLF